MKALSAALSFACITLALCWRAFASETVPDKIVVLTFDDSVASHATFVAPLLKKHGFGATFFITEGFEFLSGGETGFTVRSGHDSLSSVQCQFAYGKWFHKFLVE